MSHLAGTFRAWFVCRAAGSTLVRCAHAVGRDCARSLSDYWLVESG